MKKLPADDVAAQRNSRRGMSSVLSTLRVLEEVARRQPVGVSELARATQMPKSTVQRCLLTLKEADWLRVVDSSQSKWAVTAKPLRLGLRAFGEESIREAARPFLEELRDKTTETVHLVIQEDDTVVIVLRQDSRQAVRTYVEVGTVAPIHATASGLAILAALDAEALEEVLDRALPRFTDTTITRRADLLAEIERTRQRGYAVNADSWWRTGVSAIGVAILGPVGRPVAGIAVSIPSSRFSLDQAPEYGALALEAARKIQVVLGGEGRPG